MSHGVIYQICEQIIANGSVQENNVYYHSKRENAERFLRARCLEMQYKGMIRIIRDNDYTPQCIASVQFMQRISDVMYTCKIYKYPVDMDISIKHIFK